MSVLPHFGDDEAIDLSRQGFAIIAAHEQVDIEGTKALLMLKYFTFRHNTGADHEAGKRYLNEVLREWYPQAPSPAYPVPDLPGTPQPPDPGTPPAPALSPTRLSGRAFTSNAGDQLHVGLSRFYGISELDHGNADRIEQEDREDVAANFTYKRVLLQVGSLGEQDYWFGHVADQTKPNHRSLVRQLCQIAQRSGLRILATLIGKGNGMDRQSARRDYVIAMAEILREYPDVILLAQMMNEPYADDYCGDADLLELERLFQQHAPGILTSTGSNTGDAFGQVGTPHTDRDTTKSELQDRPWRQPWDQGMLGHPWVNDEPIGPHSSVASETRPQVLRSHALVTFLSGGAGYCFHPDQGIRGHNGAVKDVPGYYDVPKARKWLPGNVVNGTMQNHHAGFPNRHWNLEEGFLRSATNNTRGIVRVYGLQVNGAQWSVPFGPVSNFELRAMRRLEVTCYQQDRGEVLWQKIVGANEAVRFSMEYPDYLLESRAI